MSKRESRKAKWGYIYILPWLAVFCVFYAYPLVYGIGVSFTNFTLGKKEWIGLGNYSRTFSDYAFWRSLIATFFYAVIVIPIQVYIPLFIANVLRNHSDRVSSMSKMLIYLPGVICAVAQVLVWKYIFKPFTGIIPSTLARWGIANFTIYDKATVSVPVMALLIAFTHMGSQTVIYCAAVNAIPETYYEAATLDGASKWQQFWKISYPLVNPTVIYVFITSTISALQIFVIPQMMTAGGPNYTSSTLLLLVYNSAFNNHQFGYASAIGVVLFIITGIVAIIQFRITAKEEIEY